MTDFGKYFKAAFTVDNIIFGFDEADLKVLLIKRGEEPYKGEWALPGHFVQEGEDLLSAAERVLKELTGIDDVYLEQVKSFGAVDRHPHGRVITVAYYSLIKIADYNVNASSFASQAQWHSISKNKNLAFDHEEIMDECFQLLKRRIRRRPVGFELLPPKFTLTELQHLYESILETHLDKRNFRKKILSMDILVDLEEVQEGVAHRPARLFQFDQNKYHKFKEKGYIFDLSESKKKDLSKR